MGADGDLVYWMGVSLTETLFHLGILYMGGKYHGNKGLADYQLCIIGNVLAELTNSEFLNIKRLDS